MLVIIIIKSHPISGNGHVFEIKLTYLISGQFFTVL